MQYRKYTFKGLGIISAVLVILFVASVIYTGSALALQDDPPVDHSQFDILTGEFATGPEVTTACLSCHQDSASELMETTHWTWDYTTELGQQLGKNNFINSYCVAVDSNEPGVVNLVVL